MIHEPHYPQDRKAELGAQLNLPASTVAEALQLAAVLPLRSKVPHTVVQQPESPFNGCIATRLVQRGRRVAAHIAGNVYVLVDACQLLTLPGGDAA